MQREFVLALVFGGIVLVVFAWDQFKRPSLWTPLATLLTDQFIEAINCERDPNCDVASVRSLGELARIPAQQLNLVLGTVRSALIASAVLSIVWMMLAAASERKPGAPGPQHAPATP